MRRLLPLALASSATAITVLALVEGAGVATISPSATAGTAATGLGGYTLVTASVGKGPDEAPYETLYILDNRGEFLYVYGIDNASDRRLILRGGASLPALFRTARGG
ncbi:MAG: hypothetical protein RI967_1754 [Planctomycetota bacterium]|jgi:hypothetical protein